MRLLLLALVGTVACGAPLDPAFTDALTVTGGCGDVVLFARDEADTLMLRATAAAEVVAKVLDDGTPHETFVEFPSDAIAVTVEQGERLSDTTCDDVVEDPSVDVTSRWVPSSGHATIRVRPAVRDDAWPRADLVLQNVVLGEEHGYGDTIVLEDYQILDVLVGWYAG